MSKGPPGAEQPKPMLSSPSDADDTRSEHARSVIRGSAIWYGIGIGLLAALAAAFLSNNAVIFVIGAVIVLVGAVAIVFAIADNRAERDFFRGFASDHGFVYSPGYELQQLTPLLSAGDRRRSEHYMSGPLSAEISRECALAHYTFEVERSDSDGKRSYSPHHFTVCMVEIEESLPMFRGIFLSQRRNVLTKFDDGNWLRGRGFKEASLESSDFDQRYDLLIDPDQSELSLRELFSPSFVVWCTGHPLRPYFELRAGTLAVYVPDRLDEAGKLQWLLEATRDIVVRIGAELDEAPGGAATSLA